MTSTEWARVRFLLETALERPIEERSGFLASACGEDGQLRAEVEQLLEVEAQADAILSDVRWDFRSAFDGLAPGTRIGNYRVVRLLGEGGMGSVYLAERADAAYSQQVAIKLVQRTLAPSDAVKRFLRERQTLARLNHPGIAHLLDGGVTDDGHHFLVMEYVEGRPIHQYCNEEQLTVKQRVELAIRVCDAVQSAHQNLIVHQDLKPANILVTAGGDPKVLDFGIAKSLNTTPEANVATVQILTPSYASPEQASHEPVSTASDVYSLAALLFELLTGCLPHPVDGLPPHEAIRRLLETEPKLASESVSAEAAELRRTTAKSLRRALEGDLDVVLAHALRREPSRRYPTVQAFAADLNRYLLQLPVQARPDTLPYQFGKFVKRRKAPVALAAGSLAAITVAMIGMWHGYSVANAQRAIAERRYENGRRLVQSYLTEVDRKLEGMRGTTAVRSLIARRNLEYLDRMAADAKGDVSLERELAQAYFLIGRTERMMAESPADREQARIHLDKAVQLRGAIFSATGDIVDRGQFAYVLSQAGALLVQSGHLQQAVAYHKKACDLAKPILAGPAKGLNYLRGANACWNLATDYIGNEQAPYTGDFADGLKGQIETLARFKRWRDANPDNPMGSPYVASMEAQTAADLQRVGRSSEAKQHFENALSILHGPKGLLSHDLAAGYLVMAQTDYSMMLADGHELRAAVSHAEEALSIAEKQIAAQGGKDPGWEGELAFALVAAGRSLALKGDSKQGAALTKSGISILRSAYAKDRSDSEAAGALMRCDLWASDAEQALGHHGTAVADLNEVVEVARSAVKLDAKNALATEDLQAARQGLSQLRRGM